MIKLQHLPWQRTRFTLTPVSLGREEGIDIGQDCPIHCSDSVAVEAWVQSSTQCSGLKNPALPHLWQLRLIPGPGLPYAIGAPLKQTNKQSLCFYPEKRLCILTICLVCHCSAVHLSCGTALCFQMFRGHTAHHVHDSNPNIIIFKLFLIISLTVIA